MDPEFGGIDYYENTTYYPEDYEDTDSESDYFGD